MKLSAVDLSPVPRDGTAADAFDHTVEAAKQAEELGFERFWVAEHHGRSDRLAGVSPEVLLGHLAAETEEIRIGSGAVLLNHYQPFKVAEQFGVLDGLAPGRIDAGLGRANGSPAVDRALGTSRRVENPDKDHAEKIRSVLSHLHDDYPESHPYSDLSVPRSGADAPVPWLLGSSTGSATIAGELGLRFSFAAFIRPSFATQAFDAYREAFAASEESLPGGVEDPEGIVTVNAVCAETDEEAARQRAVAEATFRRIQRGQSGPTPAVEEAVEELGGVPDPTPGTLDDNEWPRAISGSPETLAGLFEQLADRVGVDEVMIQHATADHETAMRSHELLGKEVLS